MPELDEDSAQGLCRPVQNMAWQKISVKFNCKTYLPTHLANQRPLGCYFAPMLQNSSNNQFIIALYKQSVFPVLSFLKKSSKLKHDHTKTFGAPSFLLPRLVCVYSTKIMGAISLTDDIGTITLNRFTLQLAGHYAALFRTAHAVQIIML